MKSFITSVLFVFLSFMAIGQGKFSKQQVLDDLTTLLESLEESHYDLYAYTSKEDFELKYKELKNKVQQDSLTLLQTTNLFQQLTTLAKNGHTWIEFPIQSYITYAQNGGTVFPLELAFEDKKALIRKNWSKNDALAPSSEVISINGVSMNEVLAQIYPQIAAERHYLRKAKIEFYSFPRCYWQVFGKQDEFQVEIKHNGQLKTYDLKGIDIIDGYENQREEVINPKMDLTFMDNVAYLNPGGLGGDKDQYRAFIDSAFATIKAKKSKHLILDLRNNPGGDDSFSDYMVSHLTDKPFQWNSHFSLKTSQKLKEHIRKKYDTTQIFWKKALTHTNGEVYDYTFDHYQPQPAEKRFNGEVFALVNRQSYSQSAVTAAQLQDYGLATIVGEETAEYPSLFASIFQFSLPNTGIVVNISKGKITRVNGSEKPEGVIPDIIIKDELLDEKDEILDGLLKQIAVE